MAQKPYHPAAAQKADDLEATYNATAEEIHFTPPLLTFIALQKRGKLGMLPMAVLHLEDALLKSYVE